jgi:hypothetical protein
MISCSLHRGNYVKFHYTLTCQRTDSDSIMDTLSVPAYQESMPANDKGAGADRTDHKGHTKRSAQFAQ